METQKIDHRAGFTVRCLVVGKVDGYVRHDGKKRLIAEIAAS